MTTFLKTRATEQAKQREDHVATYRALISQAAADGDLKRGDSSKLWAAAEGIGRSEAEVERDFTLMRELATLRPIAAELDTRRSDHKTFRKSKTDYATETETLVAQRAERLNEMEAESAVLLGQYGEAEKAVSRISEIEKTLLQLGDSATVQTAKTARTMGIAHHFVGTSDKNVFLVEQLFTNSCALRNVEGRGVTFVRQPDQTEEEFTEALATARILGSQIGCRYLKRRTGNYLAMVPNLRDYTEYFEDLESRSEPANPKTLRLLPWPGSDRKDFAEMMAALTKLYAEYTKDGAKRPPAGIPAHFVH